jgi:uncharacterized membrane protein YecN with MAPEG domain
MHKVILASCAVMVLLYAALSLNVSVTRGRRRKDPPIPEAALTKAIRAHGNASEYIPIFVLLLLYLNSTAPGVLLAIVAVVAAVSRVFHAAGMLRAKTVHDAHPLRPLGALGTYVCLFTLGGILAWQIF